MTELWKIRTRNVPNQSDSDQMFTTFGAQTIVLYNLYSPTDHCNYKFSVNMFSEFLSFILGMVISVFHSPSMGGEKITLSISGRGVRPRDVFKVYAEYVF